jgi:hypothetical protein
MNTQFLLHVFLCLHIASATWWRPQVGSRFQIQFDDDIDTNVNADVFDLDSEVEQSSINILKAKGKKLICYVSVGSWESYRSDAARFPQSVLGKGYDGFPGKILFNLIKVLLKSFLTTISFRRKMARHPSNQHSYPDNVRPHEHVQTKRLRCDSARQLDGLYAGIRMLYLYYLLFLLFIFIYSNSQYFIFSGQRLSNHLCAKPTIRKTVVSVSALQELGNR